MMSRTLTIALTLTALIGCGGQFVPPETKTPHDGTLVALPDDRGFAEILKQADSSKPGQAQVVIYFLNPFRKPMEPAPTAATLKLQTTGGKPIVLESAPSSSMISPSFTDPGELAGSLTATIEGKEITVPIQVR